MCWCFATLITFPIYRAYANSRDGTPFSLAIPKPLPAENAHTSQKGLLGNTRHSPRQLNRVQSRFTPEQLQSWVPYNKNLQRNEEQKARADNTSEDSVAV